MLVKKLLGLSIPVKALLLGGCSFLAVWGIATWLEVRIGLNVEMAWFGVSLRHLFWGLELVAAIATVEWTSRLLMRRHLSQKKQSAPMFDTKRVEELERHVKEYRKRLEAKSLIIDHANHKLEQLVRDHLAIYEVGQQITSIVDLDAFYGKLTETLRTHLHIEEFAVMTFDDKREELVVRAANGFADDAQILRTTFRRGEGVSGLVAETGRKIYIRDTSLDKRFLHYKGERLSQSSSFLSVPLTYKNEVLGVINFGRREVAGFSAHDVEMLSLVANQVALAITNASLYTQTRALSITDDLTGCHNRRYFQQMLQMEWKRAVRFRRDLSMVMIDVDHFKQYNDTYGHLQGDRVLRDLGRLFLKNLREVDTVARFGGEEFVLLLPDTDKRGAIAVAEKVRKFVEDHAFSSGGKKTRPVTISCGIATFPHDVGAMEDLVDSADIALYRAKDQGRNRVVCYSDHGVAEEAEPPQFASEAPPRRKRDITTLQ